jgi:hypothetical protein
MTGKANTLRSKIQAYLRKNIDAITASENVLGVHLAIFYFSGAYYQVAKRLWGLRYVSDNTGWTFIKLTSFRSSQSG